ncbi:MAG: hypothetical protein HY042_03845 [Spirochaetia bacterium]|nr:hypothetical protein [Spirochaetia bacterium]
MISVRRIPFVLSALMMGAALPFVNSCGPCGRPKDPVKEAEARVEAIQSRSGLSREAVEKLGLDLDASRRACGLKFQGETDLEKFQKATLACYADAEKDLLQKGNVPAEAATDLDRASVLLRWELKAFLAAHKTTEDQLKTVFRAAWANIERCEKSVTALPGETQRALNLRQNQCSSPGLYGACANAGYNRDECGRIVSMGVAYDWVEKTITRTINPTRDRKL